MCSTGDLSSGVIDRLNQRMAEIYGTRWTSQYPRAALDTWAKGLAGMTLEQIKRGIENCVATRLAWPPTLPEFIELCLLIPGLPVLDDAWAEALDVARGWKRPHDCSHALVWHALSQIEGFNLIGEEVLRKRFAHNFEQGKKQLAAGRSLAPIPQPLPAPKDVSQAHNNEEREAARIAGIAKLDALLRRSAVA